MRRLLAQEVVQTSNMDCGPATLKCLLEGFGIPASYGRLREACQTGLDGTSIDTMEIVANQAGLEAEQIMLPVDHLLIPGANNLPAIVVVVLPAGLTHFVVVWNKQGNLLQVMDPAVGRRWVSCEKFAAEVYHHCMPVGAADWHAFAVSEPFQSALAQRLKAVGIGKADRVSLLSAAVRADGWRPLAEVDAATRLMASLVRTGNLLGGRHRAKLLERLCANPDLIPPRFWSVQPHNDEEVLMRGAVLVRVKRRTSAPPETEPSPNQARPAVSELARSLAEPPAKPGRELVRALWRSGWWLIPLLVVAMSASAGGTLIEALLFRGLLDINAQLAITGQRMGAAVALLLFGVAMFLLEAPIFAGSRRLGRQLENRLRVLFLEKIPKLSDRYFQSRLTSDMAERSHSTHRLRQLPDQARQLLTTLFQLLATGVGIVWLEPNAALFVALALAAAILPVFAGQGMLIERDLRTRTHAGGLTRFYLDAMLGLVAIRAHGAEQNVRREHDKLLSEWAQSALRLQRAVLSIETIQMVAAIGVVIALILTRPLAGSEASRILLVAYWALNLPVLGQELATLARQYPAYRNQTLRLLDPLGAPEVSAPEGAVRESVSQQDPPSIEFKNVSFEASGHSILNGINLALKSGDHVAVVGPSGAGKSSLVGMLLGWSKPSQGAVLVNGAVVDHEALRSITAWVDPSVQIWNRTLFSNLTYGSPAEAPAVGDVIDAAMLRNVLESLPEGLQTKLGEGGGLVSGGEGQRVRLGRAMLREDVRLVILDEPFRGLDREKRHELLARARHFWRQATLICITHDVSETRAFDQVVVVERGRIAERGEPSLLTAQPASRYAQLLSAEDAATSAIWKGGMWRRIQIHSGQITEELPKPFDEERVRSAVA